jgi:hypothetical protein
MPLPSIKLPAIPWRKILIWTLEGVLAVIAVGVLAAMLLMGRIIYGPITTTSLTPWIEAALSQQQYGIKAKIAQTTLHWDKARRQVVLDLSGVQFVDPLDQKVADVPQILAIFAPLGYFSETHSPWIINVRRPQLHLRVDQGGTLRLGALQAGESNIVEKDEDTPLTPDALRNQLKDLVKSLHRGAFSLFSNFTLDEASISLIDEPRNEGWYFKIPQLTIKRVGRDKQGSAKILITKQNKETELEFNMRYAARERLFQAGLTFKDVDPEMLTADRLPVRLPDYTTSRFSGAVSIAFNNDLEVKSGDLNLELGPGDLIIKDYYPAPQPMKKFTLTAAYSSTDKTIRLDPYRLELEKALVTGTAQIKLAEETRGIGVQVKLSDLNLEDLPQYWPENVAVNPRRWILANMQKGLAEEVTANVDLSLPDGDINKAAVDRIGGTIKLKDVDLRYWGPMPLLNKVSATSTYDANQFDIDVKGGEMGAIRLKPSHVIISGISSDMQYADVEAHLEGPAGEVLKVLDREPLGYASKMKIDPNVVTGSMNGVLKTKFPLLNALELEEMEIAAEVKLKDLGIKKIVDFLTVEDGEVALNVNTKTLLIDGQAKVNGVPAHVRWDEKFSAAEGEVLSHGVATAKTGAEAAQQFGVDFDVSSDPMPITVVYDRYPNLSRLSVSGDAKDAALHIFDLGYHKKAGAAANINLSLEWGGDKPMRFSRLDLNGEHLNVKGDGHFDSTGKKLQKLTLDPFVAGRSKAKIEFERGADQVPQWTVSGDALDISGLMAPSPQPEEKKIVTQVQATDTDETVSPLRVDLKVGRVITGEKTELGNTVLKGTRDDKGWVSLNVSTVAAEQTPFNLTLGPSGKITVLEANTPNLGNLLRSLDVTDTVVGGRFQMNGKTGEGDALRNIFGHIKINEFQVKDMPFLLKLLGAISPDASEVGKSNLRFTEFSSEYLWKRDEFVFTKSNTATGTLGLTAAGKIDLVNYAMDLQGQVIPVYFISRIIGAIPVIGDILTGGNEGGLFAATYTVKGPLAKPEMSVNPVSVLAPGIIRDILFTDPNITKDKKAPAPAPAAPEAKTPRT